MDLRNVTIVADQDYFPLIFSLKNKHPECSWKVITREELLDRVSFSFAKDPIPTLIKNGISYNDAKKYLSIFRAADFAKNENLVKVYDLIKDSVTTDELGLYEIKSRPLLLLEMNEDIEVQGLLKRKGLEFSNISFADLGATRKPVPPVYSFPDRISQYHYIYSEIRARLLKDPSLANRITVLMNDVCDIYMVKYVSDLYGIRSFATYGAPFLSDATVKAKVNEIYAKKKFEFTEEEKSNVLLRQLHYLVSFYGLDALDFDFAYSNLIEITNAQCYREKLDDSGITIENRFQLTPDEIIYVTCFQYDVFHKEFDDKNVLSDAELLLIGANPSYVKTNLDRRKKKNYILYNEIPFLSRARQHLKDKIYNSQFLEELDSCMRERGEEGFDEKDLWVKHVEKKNLNNENGVYTTKASNIYIGDQYDKKFYRGKSGEYRSYDHSFKGIVSGTPCARNTWSVTNLEQYPLCPFKYYLTTVLPDKSSDKHLMWIGTLAHSLFEKVYDDDYDFDLEWDIASTHYKNEVMKEGLPYNGKEEAYLEIVKDWLHQSVLYVRKTKKGMGYVSELAERPIRFELKSDDGFSYVFTGKIDKILLTENGPYRYYSVIDYKTGSEKFEANDAKRCFLGSSIQVPLYVYALANQTADPYKKIGDKGYIKRIDEIDGYRFGACGIEPVLFSAKHFFRKERDNGNALLPSSLEANIKLGGIRMNDPLYKNSVDPDVLNDKGKAVPQSSDLLGQKLFFTSMDAEENILGEKAPNYTKYNLNDLIEDAKQGAIESIENILANKFDIAPTSKDLLGKKDGLQCKYCIYRDICYRHPTDIKNYADLIDAKFGVKAPFAEPEEEEKEEEDNE